MEALGDRLAESWNTGIDHERRWKHDDRLAESWEYMVLFESRWKYGFEYMDW